MTTKNSKNNPSKNNRSTSRNNTTSKDTSRVNSNRNPNRVSKNYEDSYYDEHSNNSHNKNNFEPSTNYSDNYPSKESNLNDNYSDNYDESENQYSKGNNRYSNDEPINDPPYDDYDNSYSDEKGNINNDDSNYSGDYPSKNNTHNYEYNDERNNHSETTTNKGSDEYREDNYNHNNNNNSSYSKGGNNSNDYISDAGNDSEEYDHSPENYNYTPKGGGIDGNNGTDNTSETIENNPNSSGQTNSTGISSFIDRFGSVRFRNSNDINRFFAENSQSPDFMHWFKDNIGGRSYWRERSLRNISQQDAQSFNMVWDKIPYLFRGREENYTINLFQFFGLVSIMINEVGSRFTPIRERGSLSYMFNTIIPATERRPQRRKTSYNNPRNNMTAYQLFNDEHFLRAHSGMPHYNLVANTSNRAWHGTEYPRGIVTRPSTAGIIAEADFYKFSGRGLIQTTWSRSYIRLIEHTLSYNGNNPIILEYKNEWQQSLNQHRSLRIIASQTKNSDWDRLFMETQNEFACIAVYKFQEHRNRFLEEIEVDARRLQGNRIGSLYYIGYKVGGRESYGNKVKNRCLQMMNKLMENH